MDWLLGSERRHGRDRDGERYYGDDDGRHGGREGHGRGRDRDSHQEEREYDRLGGGPQGRPLACEGEVCIRHDLT